MKVGIIGGGVYGASIAYFLKRFGADEVILFERNHLASGSTAYSAGIVRHHYSLEEQIRAARRGREILQNFEEYTGQESGFCRTGYLRLAATENEPRLRKIVERQKQLDIGVELVQPEALQEYVPSLASTGVSIGAYECNAGFADPYLVTTGFAEAARERGADLRTKTPVVNLRVNDGTVTEIETPDGSHEVDYVINASGPWGGDIAEMVGLELPLQWHESKLAVLTAEESYGLKYPIVSDHSMQPDMYTKPESSGEFLVGGIDRPSIDKDAKLEGVDNEYLRQVADRVEQRFPGYSNVRVVDTWSGIITKTPDSHQIIGVPEGYSNFFNIVGNSGHGFKESPAFAEAIAKYLVGEDPGLDLSIYRLERFENDNPLTNQGQH